jgi:hypothetical protein
MIMFYDYMLKFNSETECNEMLFTVETFNDQQYLTPKYTAVDVIGVIYEPSEDPEVAPAAIPGWHANVRSTTEAPELEQYQVFPVTPVRVWA